MCISMKYNKTRVELPNLNQGDEPSTFNFQLSIF